MNDSSLGVVEENPWNDFLNEYSDQLENNTSILENTSSNVASWYPVSSKFWRSQSILRCKICERIIICNNFANHFVSEHLSEDNKNIKKVSNIDNNKINNNINNNNYCDKQRMKRSKKKRIKLKPPPAVKEQSSTAAALDMKKRRNFPTNKRSHSVFRDDDDDNCDYNKRSKNCRKRKKSDKLFNCDNSTLDDDDDETTDLNQMVETLLNTTNEEDMIDVGLFNTTATTSSSGDIAPFIDDSLNNRISSDSSTPPSLSLGGASSNLHTLSSPGSCLQSVNAAEHYHLPLSSSNSCYKYQIDSLPWENIPLPSQPSHSLIESSEDCGEIERAVQSITSSLYANNNNNDTTRRSQLLFIAHNDSQQDVTYRETKPPPLYPATAADSPSQNSLTNDDDVSIIDSFLDEIVQQQQLQTSSTTTNDNTNNATSNDNLKLEGDEDEDNNSAMDYHTDQNNTLFSNNFMSDDYDEKFEALINSALSDFVTHSPNNNTNQTVTTTVDNTVAATDTININQDSNYISINTPTINTPPPPPVNLKRGSSFTKNSSKSYDPLKHCGVSDQNGEICFRGLLCKHHTMPQKRLVDRPESISSLIKAKKAKKKIPVTNDVNIVVSPNITLEENRPPVIYNTPIINRKKLNDTYKPLVEPNLNEALIIKQNRDANKSYMVMESMVWKSVLKSKESTTGSISNSKPILSDFKPNLNTNQVISESQIKVENDVSNNVCVSGYELGNKVNVNINNVGSMEKNVVKDDIDKHDLLTRNNVAKSELLLPNRNIKDTTPVNILKTNTPKPPVLTNNAKIYNPYITNPASETSTNPVAPLSTLPKQLLTQPAIYYQQFPGNNNANNITEPNMAPAQQLFYPIRTAGALAGSAGGAGRILMVMNGLPQTTPTISIPNPQHPPTSTLDASHLLDNNNGCNANASISIGGLSNNNTSSLSTNTSTGMPLTVHSSTPNGITQRFVILPDGTISGAAANQNNYANQQLLTAGSNLRSAQNTPGVTKFATHTASNNQHQPTQDNKIIITAPHANNAAVNHQFIMPPAHNAQHLVSPHHFQTIAHPDNTANFSLYQQPHPQQKITFQLPLMSPHPNTGQFLLASHPTHPQAQANQISFKPPPHSTNSNTSFLLNNSTSSDSFTVTSTPAPNSTCIATTSSTTSGNLHEQQPYSVESSIITVDSQSSTPVKGNAYSLCPDVGLKPHQQPQSISINTGHSNNSLITGHFASLNPGHNPSLVHNHPSPSPSGMSDTTNDTNLILSSQQKHSTATAIMFHTPQLSRQHSNTSNSSDQQQIYTNNSNLSNYFKTNASIAPTLVISPRFIQQHNTNQIIASTPGTNFSPHNFSANNHAATVYRATVNNAIGHGNLLQQTNNHCPITQTPESQSNSSIQSNTDIQLDDSTTQMKSNDFVVMHPVMGQ